jgi:hypothetical protein
MAELPLRSQFQKASRMSDVGATTPPSEPTDGQETVHTAVSTIAMLIMHTAVIAHLFQVTTLADR